MAGSKPLFTSGHAKGLIYDGLCVNPVSYSQRKADWEKVVKVYYKCVDYILDEKTKEDAATILAAKVGAEVKDYLAAMKGTHFLTLEEAKTAYKKGTGLDSVYGSMTLGNKFNLDNKVYTESQKPESYLVPSIVNGLK